MYTQPQASSPRSSSIDRRLAASSRRGRAVPSRAMIAALDIVVHGARRRSL
jgi:hypothetical protein